MKSLPTTTLLALGASFVLTGTALSLEIRTWLHITGSTLEAELVRADGDEIALKDKTGREIKVKKGELSIADRKYIDEFSKKDSNPLLGDETKKERAVPVPAKLAKIDQKTFKKLPEKFQIPQEEFEVIETPHFQVMYPDPKFEKHAFDLAEMCERVWLETAFFHDTFMQKFTDRRMAVFLVDDQYTYESLGKWQAEMILSTKHPQAEDQARGLLATWGQAASSNVQLTQDIAEKNKVLPIARIFRGTEKKGYSERDKEEIVKGVWVPFRVHCLARDLIGIQAGGVSGFGSKGYYAFSTGHAYYKEIQLTGRSETAILSAQGTDSAVKSEGGFKNSTKWADELKKRIRKGEVEPKLDILYTMTQHGANDVKHVLAYSFSNFLQSTTSKIEKYAEIVKRIDTSSQMPEPETLAKDLGYASVAELEKAWLEFINSSQFK